VSRECQLYCWEKSREVGSGEGRGMSPRWERLMLAALRGGMAMFLAGLIREATVQGEQECHAPLPTTPSLTMKRWQKCYVPEAPHVNLCST